MKIRDDQRTLLEACSITYEGKRGNWNVIARAANRSRRIDDLAIGVEEESGKTAQDTAWLIRCAPAHAREEAAAHIQSEIESAGAAGAKLTTVLDDDYPINLRSIPNLPPFLFYLGELDADADCQSMAVVGTRAASPEGLKRARNMACAMVDRGIAVTSGLAAGIDTAAHEATLHCKGRTIAVFGTGITHVFPQTNRELAKRIIDSGGLTVSQFFPSQPPTKWTFRRRNEVTSGISQGTIVIEASSTSGAKMQARLAYEHGKRVFLVRSLVSSQQWARDMIASKRATAVEYSRDVVVAPTEKLRAAQQVAAVSSSSL